MSNRYVPPRSQWAQPDALQQQRQYTTSPLANGATANIDQVSTAPSHKRAGSESYYEDVDPRFAVEEPSDDGFRESGALGGGLPGALTPGGMPPGAISHLPGGYPTTPGAQQAYQHQQQQRMNPEYLHPSYQGGPVGTNDSHNSSDNDIPLDNRHASGGSFDGDRASERASEASHFTSISERPVNPNWQPPAQSGPQPRRQQDVLLAQNPDFSIPGMRGGRGRGGNGPIAASAMGGPGLTGAGRYPTEI